MILRLALAVGLSCCSGILRAQDCPSGRLALVLSGGGAKGFAHIGVLKTLDRLGIHPDLVVGTSMGSIIGALYASGYTGSEIDSMAHTLPLTDLFRAYAPRVPHAWGKRLPLLLWASSPGGLVLETAAAGEIDANSLLNAALLRGNLLARGNFDSLPIPFRAVATDLRDRAVIVLRYGDLVRAVRASAAIPLVFPPEPLDGRPLADGGLSANIPVMVARDAGATTLIVSDATERPATESNFDSPLAVADQLLNFLFRQAKDSLGTRDFLVRPGVEGFKALDFAVSTMERLVALGKAAADSSLSPWPCAASTPALHRAALPTQIGRIVADSGPKVEVRFLEDLLDLREGDSLDLKALRERLALIREAEGIREAWLNPSGVGDRVTLHPSVRRASDRVAAVGLAYDHELSGRVWLAALDRRAAGSSVEASGLLSLGRLRQGLDIALRRHQDLYLSGLTPLFDLNLQSEKVRQFTPAGAETLELDTRDAVIFAGLERLFSQRWSVQLGVVDRFWRVGKLAQDHNLGFQTTVLKRGLDGEHTASVDLQWGIQYRRMVFELAPQIAVGRTTIIPKVGLGWSDGAPPELHFPLGGEDGFPGFHLGERRSRREVSAGLQSRTPVLGPVQLRAEAALGRGWDLDSPGAPAGWIAGGRIGVGVDTPIGPLFLDYGRSTLGRGAVRFRVGRWF